MGETLFSTFAKGNQRGVRIQNASPYSSMERRFFGVESLMISELNIVYRLQPWAALKERKVDG